MNELPKFSMDAGEFFGQVMRSGLWFMIAMSLATLHMMMHLVVWALGWILRGLT